MPETDKVRQIREMKEALQQHYERFKELRRDGRNEEALQQFNLTLKAATELMEVSTRVLKELSGPRPEVPTVPSDGKVLHFPGSRHTH
ncbi:MAG: hypothetical protein OEW11_01555 [Nitrospirota bacterium]|nr:hypothetical protein [Nitrospirota bacterium]